MLHLFKWLTPAIAAVALVLAFAPTSVRAEDTAATGSVTGQVVDASGKGVPSMKVHVYKHHEKGQKPESAGEATTDADGKFTIANVPAGEYMVAAGEHGSALHGHEKATVVAGSPVTVTITVKEAAAKPAK